MNREEVNTEILEICKSYNSILCELPTGHGKTKQALSIVKTYKNKGINNILIVVPRNVLKGEWKKEIIKWKAEGNDFNYTFTTYVSLPKYIGKWDFVIFDEAHHLSERCREALSSFNIGRTILLSATVTNSLKDDLYSIFNNLYCYTIKTREAIDNGVLPDPRVYIIPLTLSNTIPTEYIIKNPKAKGRLVESSWATRWQYIRQKKYPVKIYCTQKQYIEDLNGQIDWFKRRAMHSQIFKNKWLRLCNDRLHWLADKKTPFIKTLLDKLDNERTLTFCNSIEQTEELGKYCINSKNKNSEETKEKFNMGKINHITACNMVNEGVNLTNCRIGIYANLNSSEIIIKQRLGRILRHKDPIIIVPFYKDTREGELVNKMLEDYNPKLIKVIENLNKLKL